jgi:hypothetical protein
VIPGGVKPPIFMSLPPLQEIFDLAKNRDDFPMHLKNVSDESLTSQALSAEWVPYKKQPKLKPRPEYSQWRADALEIVSPVTSLDSRFSYPDDTASFSNSADAFAQSDAHDIHDPNVIPDDPKRVIRPWSQEEDQRLAELVKIYGENWKVVSKIIRNRTSRQCNHHWTRVLAKRTEIDPLTNEVSKVGLWAEEEDLKLLKEYEAVGPKWQKISTAIPGRNARQCEKRFHRLKQKAEPL